MKRSEIWTIAAFAILAGVGPQAQAQTVPAETRGQLLYTTHCISCHTAQMHWRNNRLAYDWGSLKAQVRRWQGNANLQWGDADIAEVAHHLNDTIYHYPQTAARVEGVQTVPARGAKRARFRSGPSAPVMLLS